VAPSSLWAVVVTTASVVSGAILGGLLFVFNAINTAVAWALEESDNFRLDPGSAQLFEGPSYMLAIEGAFVAAIFVGAASHVFRRYGCIPHGSHGAVSSSPS
jgi:hypothetical protein